MTQLETIAHLTETIVAPPNPHNNEDWDDYKRLVLAELERLSDAVDGMRREISLIRIEVGALKVKAGAWGFFAGAIPAAVVALYYILSD